MHTTVAGPLNWVDGFRTHPSILGRHGGRGCREERKLTPYRPRVGLNSCASMKEPEGPGSAPSDQATLFSPPGVSLPLRNRAVPAQR